MSLKETLYQTIKDEDFIRLDELHRIAIEGYFKISNAERRLRELVNSGLVTAIRNNKGVIIAYKLNSDHNGINTSVSSKDVTRSKISPQTKDYNVVEDIKSILKRHQDTKVSNQSSLF